MQTEREPCVLRNVELLKLKHNSDPVTEFQRNEFFFSNIQWGKKPDTCKQEGKVKKKSRWPQTSSEQNSDP